VFDSITSGSRLDARRPLATIPAGLNLRRMVDTSRISRFLRTSPRAIPHQSSEPVRLGLQPKSGDFGHD